MPSLSTGLRLGSGSVSNLLKSANTLEREIAAYEDDAAKIAYANSGHTDDAYQAYVSYLSSRIDTLQQSGRVPDLTKAQNMQQEIVTATHSNISFHIQQENMAIMAQGDSGTVAGYQMKMNVIADQFQRAVAIGDNTLAFTLQNQYYSVSQSLQKAQQAAADAATTLQKANAAFQGDVVQSLRQGLEALNAAAKNASLGEFNGIMSQWVQDNAGNLKALGVAVDANSQPNYFDIVNAVQGAIYNHTLLEAQAMRPYDAPGAANKVQEATNMLNGATTINTLGGSMTAFEVQQAASNPSMFAYDNATGTYKKTAQIGYTYQTDANGKNVLVPMYSGISTDTARNKVFFLTPQQTTMMTSLGLDFNMNKNGTTGDGVQVQATNATPGWLKNVLGSNNGITNMYTDMNGQLTFRAGSSGGDGFSAYILSSDGMGHYGTLEQTAEGTILNAGGDYGFNANAAQQVINDHFRALASQPTDLKVGQPAQYASTMKLSTALSPATAPALKMTPPEPAAVPQLTAPSPQKTANPQTTTSPQTTGTPQSTGGGFNLNQSGSGGIKLGGL